MARVENTADEIFVDGTFNRRVTGWDHVLNVATITKGVTTLLYVVLMKNKKRKLYIQTLKMIADDLKIYMNVKTIHSDYEEALMAASEEAFANARTVGCQYHYVQSIFRKLRKSGKHALTYIKQ